MRRVILFTVLVIAILLIVGMVAAQEPPPLGDSIVIKWDWMRYRNYLPVVILK